MTSGRDWSDARQVWDHHLMHHTPRPRSVIVGLGSHDLGVADVAAEFYLLIEQPVPDAVVAAYERLVEAGFTRRLIA